MLMDKTQINFLQYCLEEKKSLSKDNVFIDWQDFFQFCFRHSIAGLVFAGLERADRRIPQQVFFEWFSVVEGIKRQNTIVEMV